MSTAIPPFIKKGALFGLVSPAGKLDARYIQQAESFLEANGFRSKRGAHPGGEYYQFAGTDEQRIEDLQSMLDDPEVEVIWCCRGGYGTVRIIEELDFSKMPENPKWIIGFSDITTFHATLQNNYNVASIHGPMPVNIKTHAGPDWQHLIDLLMGHDVVYNTPPHHLNREGTAGGQLIGGNLSLLCTLSGTKYDFDPSGKILFIEEVGEQLYHLDRMMHTLGLGGKLKNLSGLVVGQFTEMKDNLTPFGKTANEIIFEAVKHFDYPVVFDFPSGHSTLNEPLLFGAQAHMQVNSEGGMLIYI
jgi:muramoyltetrapeptide carboxypeptidase